MDPQLLDTGAQRTRGVDFELSVEAGAGSPGGVTYSLKPKWHAAAWRSYPQPIFQPVRGP